MITLLTRTKLLALVLIISLLSCGPKEIRQETPKILSPELAKTVDWHTQSVKFKDIDGEEYWVYIDGWNETGFILNRPKHPYTVPYEDLQNTIGIETNYSNTGKGVKLGLLYGAVGVVALSVLAATDNSDDGSDLEGMRYSGYAYAAIVWTLLTVGIGVVLGSGSHQYIKFHYNAEDFRANPWTRESSEENIQLLN